MNIRSNFFACLILATTIGASAATGCDDSKGGSSTGSGAGAGPAESPGEQLCKAIADSIASCGAATPCDDALVKDCAKLVGILSDGYVESVTRCIKDGDAPAGCLIDGLQGLEPTKVHQKFATTFCDECVFGVPGCSDAFFGSSDVKVGGVILPLGDELVSKLTTECSTGFTCLAEFSTCAQTVLAKQAIPENTLQCFLDTMLEGGPSEPVKCSGGSGGGGSQHASSGSGSNAGGGGSGPSSGTGNHAGGAGGGGGEGPSSTSGSSTSSGGGTCGSESSCIDCQACAVSGPCQSELEACDSNPDCTDFWDCLGACDEDDAGCQNDCVVEYPGGFEDYDALSFCILCDTCEARCQSTCG